jgi:hypothetical protein
VEPQHPLLASTGGGLDQSTASGQEPSSGYIGNGCLTGSRGVIFPGSHRKGKRGDELPKELERRQDRQDALQTARAELEAAAVADNARRREKQARGAREHAELARRLAIEEAQAVVLLSPDLLGQKHELGRIGFHHPLQADDHQRLQLHCTAIGQGR